MTDNAEDPVLQSSRREALVVFVTWLCAMTYTVSYCYAYGYGRTASDLKFVRLFWGIAFPDWVFWGIVLPWSVCFVVSWWFSYVFMTDADLGEELEEADDIFGSAGGENDA
jgi:hypothetical protein